MTTTRRSPLRRMSLLLAVTGLVPLLAACPKKHQPEVADAEPAPVPTDAAPVVIVPLEEDAGVDSGPDAAKHTGTGRPQDPIVARLVTCCNALTAQAKANGNPPEIMQAVNMCNATAAQLKANPNAPELNALRPLLGMLKSAPNVCKGL